MRHVFPVSMDVSLHFPGLHQIHHKLQP